MLDIPVSSRIIIISVFAAYTILLYMESLQEIL